MRELSDFQRGQIVGDLLAGEYLTKTATLLGVSRETVSKVMTAYTNHVKTSSAERNSDRKPKLCERDRRTLKRIMFKNQRTAATKVKAELNIHREDSVSTKTVRRELPRSKIHSRAAIAKPLIIEDNDKRRKRWCGDQKT